MDGHAEPPETNNLARVYQGSVRSCAASLPGLKLRSGRPIRVMLTVRRRVDRFATKENGMTATQPSRPLPATLIPGDGIGPEITDAVVAILGPAVAARRLSALGSR